MFSDGYVDQERLIQKTVRKTRRTFCLSAGTIVKGFVENIDYVISPTRRIDTSATIPRSSASSGASGTLDGCLRDWLFSIAGY